MGGRNDICFPISLILLILCDVVFTKVINVHRSSVVYFLLNIYNTYTTIEAFMTEVSAMTQTFLVFPTRDDLVQVACQERNLRDG